MSSVREIKMDREELGLYVIVGSFLEEFGVLIKPSEDVAAFVAGIKEVSLGLDDIDLDEMELCLAHQPTGDWLPYDSDEVKALKEGDEVTINKLCVVPLCLEDKLSQYFDATTLGKRKIHKICYQMTCEERFLRSQEVRDDEVKLWRSIVGDGTTTFSVITKKLGRVQDLQARLKKDTYLYALDIREETINIYEAVDENGDSFNSFSTAMPAVRAGDQAVVDKWLQKKLDPLKTITEVFHNFQEHTIQFLALPPSKIVVREYESNWSPAEPFEEVARYLKNAHEVSS